MTHSAEFFKVRLHNNKQLEMSNLNQTEKDSENKYIENLRNDSKNMLKNNHLFEDDDKFIEILDVCQKYIFGTIGKNSIINQTPLRKLKDEHGDDIDNDNYNLVDYRYFLFDTKSLKVIVIKNSTAPAFKTLFRNFLYSSNNDNILSNITVNPILDQNINTKLNRIKTITSLNMRFDSDSFVSTGINSIKDTFNISNESIRNIDLSISLKNQPLDNNVIELLSDEEFMKGEFKKFEMKGISTSKEDETLEFVERLLISYIDLDISDEELINNDIFLMKIKKALEKALTSN